MKKGFKLGLFSIVGLGLIGASLTSCGPKGSEETYDLIYRSWDLGTGQQNNAERQLVQAFEETHNVKVKIVENPGSGNNYWTNIQASVQNKIDNADVMMIPNMDWPLAAGYLLNIEEYVRNDTDFQNVPQSIRDACTFGNGVYALPARMNLQGYFLNVDLVDSWGIDAENISVNSEFSVIEDIIDEGFSHVNEGQIGLDTTTHWIDTQASVLDETGTLGYYTWDGEQYHLDEPAFISSVQNAKSHYQAKHTLDAYTPEEKQSIFNLDPEEEPRVDLWNKGGLALRYGYTYEIPDMLKYNALNNEYRFIGNPGGKITIVGDYYGINKETTNPQLAYEFAKWMSFGKDGFAKRMELYAKPENGGFMNTLPLTTDSETINEYFDLFGEGSGMDGLSDAFTYIETGGMVEGTKVVPGYLSARQTKKTGLTVPGPEGNIDNCNMFDLLNQCVTGSANITEYTSGEINIDDLADATYTDWWDKNGANYTD